MKNRYTHKYMIKGLTFLTIYALSFMIAYGQTKDSITHTLLVADYDYTCHTSDADGNNIDVSYGITLQVAQNMACTMGQKRHNGENDKSEQLLYVPTTWQNYPQGKMTSVETIPPYRYQTVENMSETNWALHSEHDTICNRPCQKATGEYGGRVWTVWFAESLPTRFGPWRLNGLPGLIMRAVSKDGIHRFECRKVEAVKEVITYSVPGDVVKCTRNKFVKLRNRIFGNPNYVSNPVYYIKTAELENVFVMDGTLMFGNAPVDMKPAKFQPLDY
ncbi:MAG: GLPGLI family protein [Prevotellaceae bacterium]|nr:GLPGLI family protein [Prevotellaceae bacterium]